MTRPTTGMLHHVEIWVPDLDRAVDCFGWLLDALGWTPFQSWGDGRSWRLGTTYLVFERSRALTADQHDRCRPGLNHLAFHVQGRGAVDALVTEAAQHGWSLMFPDRHPHAGGEQTYAAYLENADGFEVELVAIEAEQLDLAAASWAHLCSGPDHDPGGGVDIPEALRGLAAATDLAQARRWADRLYDLVYHSHSGGYLLPAEAVVPHLIRLGSSGPAVVRAMALGFLVDLGGGGWSGAESCPGSEGFASRTTAAVRAGLPTYYAQVKSPDAIVRAAAFVLITVLEHEALMFLRGDERIAVQTGPPITSARYRAMVDRLHEHDWDPSVRRHLGLAKIDPLFGQGEEHGIEYLYDSVGW